MDGQNFLFLGIDGKSNLSQLIATRYDMTALLPGTELSVAPTYEYESDQPSEFISMMVPSSSVL